MTEKIVGAQYRVISDKSAINFRTGDILTLVKDDGTNLPYFENEDGENEWMPLADMELITPTATAEETEPNSLDSLAQGLNTLVTEHGMATVIAALHKWTDFHSKGRK